MSFNANDKNPVIHPGNYEEYFILYMDNELSEKDKAAVEAFLSAHPELQEEFDLMMSMKLPADDIFLADKENLMADSMKVTTLEEDLLLYLDDELPDGRKAVLAQQLEKDEQLARQYGQLLQTKLDPAETIPYPNKAELYRHGKRDVRLVPFLRVAAAVIILAFLGLFYWMNSGQADTPPAVAATPKAGLPASRQPAEAGDAPAAGAIMPGQQSSGAATANTTARNNGKEQPQKRALRVEAPVLPLEQIAHTRLPVPELQEEDASTGMSQATVAAEPLKEILNNPAVTSTEAGALNMQITPQQSEHFLADGSVSEPIPGDRRKGSVKGLLRKATRLIERSTGINPVNEDDELLIGALSVKLK